MALSAQVTLAFSKKQEAWTTRYSFVSTCYANCSDHLISFKVKNGQGKAWLHDSNPSRNTFYESGPYPSSLEVAFNDGPSIVKVFKSLSLESNQENWSASFSTNEEYSDENNQLSEVVYEFEDKEGFKYLELPRSIKNSTANVIVCPQLSTVSPSLFLSPNTEDQINDQLGAGVLSFSLFFDASSQSVSVPSGRILCAHNGQLKGLDEFYEGNELSNLSLSSLSDGAASVSVDSWDTAILDVPAFMDVLNSFLSFPLFVGSNPAVNGDQMRGPYLSSKLQCITSEPLELHAVNVDYEFSSSAARLTQNS